MIYVLASEREIAIVATNAGYARFVACIEQSFASPDGCASIDCELVKPSPYDQSLSVIKVVVTSGPNHFEWAGDTLRISGSQKALGNLKDNLPMGVEYDGPIPYHHHYDVLSFPDFVSEHSPEVVLELARDT